MTNANGESVDLTQERKEPSTLFEILVDASNRAIEVSDGRLRLANGEVDASNEPDIEANVFFKLDESRFGRDFKLYDLIDHISKGQGLILLLEEVVLPLHHILPESYQELASPIIKYGLDILPVEMHDDWKNILAFES